MQTSQRRAPPPRPASRSAARRAVAPMADHVDLRAAIETEIELSGAGRSRAELPVDVVEVGSGDDGEIHACGAECFDRSAQGDGVSGAVGNGGAVPVEDNGLEAPVHLWRKRNGNLERVHWALRCRCHRNRTHRRRRRRASHRRHRGHLVRRTTERDMCGLSPRPVVLSRDRLSPLNSTEPGLILLLRHTPAESRHPTRLSFGSQGHSRAFSASASIFASLV